jgi:hypothetical protein
LKVVRRDQHGRPCGGRAVDGPVADEGDHNQEDTDQRKRPRQPTPNGRPCRHDLLRAAEADLRLAVLARLKVEVARSLKADLRPQAVSGHGYPATLSVG